MAGGGEVSHFCESGKSHNPDCEYYMADGGLVPMGHQGDKTNPALYKKKMKVQLLSDASKLAAGGRVGQEVPAEEIPQTSRSGQPVPQEELLQEQKSEKSGTEVPAEEIPSSGRSGQLVPTEEIPQNQLPEESPGLGEQLKAGAEAFATGAVGELATAAEVAMGVKREDIEKRKKDFPATQTVAGVAGGVAPMLLPVVRGSLILANVVYPFVKAAADNTGKAILGDASGDVDSVVANTIMDGGINALGYTVVGGMFSKMSKSQLLRSPKIVEAAKKVVEKMADKPLYKAIGAAVPGIGYLVGDTSGALTAMGGTASAAGFAHKLFKEEIDKILVDPFKKLDKRAFDAITYGLTKGEYALVPGLARFGQRVFTGESALSGLVEGTIKSLGSEVYKKTLPREEDKKQLDEWVTSGGINNELMQKPESPVRDVPGFAKGGEVQGVDRGQGFAELYPTENFLLSNARGRVYNYLNSIRPVSFGTGLPFDTNTEQKQKKRDYDNALGIAAQPLYVFNKMDKGTLTPDDMRHLTSMYPEVYSHMSKKMTERILRAQISGERPSYKKRQMMSLFLGSSLDSTFTPGAISTIQGVFSMQKQAAQQGGPQLKKGTKPLSKSSNSFLTDDQARTRREQNQRA